MSTTYEIYKFAKPTLKELSIVDYYSDYDVFSILDEDGDSTGEFISLFRIDDKSVSNIVDSRFVRKLELPEFVTDYNSLYEYIGFDKEAIKKKQVHIECSDGWYMDFTDSTKTKSVRIEDLDKFKNINVIQIKFFMMKTVYHTLSCIENTVQLRNAGFIKWTKAQKIGV